MRMVITAGAVLMAILAGSPHSAAQQRERDQSARRAPTQANEAKATLQDARGETVGEVAFRETPSGVLIRADLHGLPAGTHGFHLHEVGACDAPTFESAGGHFSAEGKKHGFFGENGPHAGDLPNIHVRDEGRTSFEMLNSRVTLGSGAASLLDADGSAVVVHAGQDDYRTDPAGGAGDRLACGVIARIGDR